MKKLLLALSISISTLFVSCVPAQAQSEAQLRSFVGTITGTNTYSILVSSITSSQNLHNRSVSGVASNTNTGASTLKLNTYTAYPIVLNGSALVAGDIPSGILLEYIFNLPLLRWELQRAGSGMGGGTVTNVTASSPLSSTGGTTPNISITSPLPIANGGTNNSSAFTAGSGIFSDGTKLTQDNANFFYDDATNSICIGTTVSTAKITGRSSGVGSTSSNTVVSAVDVSTYNATAGTITNTAVDFNNAATRSAGANDLTNIALSLNASGAQKNYALIAPTGKVGFRTSTPIYDVDLSYSSALPFGTPGNLPSINVENTNPSVGDGVTTFNTAGFRVGAGTATVSGYFAAGNNSGGGFFPGVGLGTFTNHGISFITNVNLFPSEIWAGKIASNGNWGMGAYCETPGNDPLARLDVRGASGLTLRVDDGNATASDVWTATDNLGNGQWSPPVTSGTAWQILGNASTIDGTHFIGTTDNIPLNIKVNNQKAGRIDNTLNNSFFGYQAGNVESTGQNNVAIGSQAMLLHTGGDGNTVLGWSALSSSVSGVANTAVGGAALLTNSSGASNTAIGSGALTTNTTGSNNTALGAGADVSVNSLTNATAIGAGAVVSASNSMSLGDISPATSVGIGTTAPASLFHVAGTTRFGLASTTNASLIFNNSTNANTVTVNSGATSASYALTLPTAQGAANTVPLNNGSGVLSWTSISSVGWALLGNSGTSASTNFIGTTDDVPLVFKVNNQKSGRIDNTLQNTFLGYLAGNAVTTSTNNVGIGTGALSTITTDGAGSNNTAIGISALTLTTSGISNVAVGASSMLTNTTGGTNTALGRYSLYTNSTGSGNVGLGYYAGFYETASNAFYIDNQDRTNLATQKTNSLLYGTFNATPASQALMVNAVLSTSQVGNSAGNVLTTNGTQTLTNKRITQRVVSASTSYTITPTIDATDITSQVNTEAGAGTLVIAAPTGTPTDGQILKIRIKSTNAQTYSFNAIYRGSTDLALPTTVTAAKTVYLLFFYNSTDTKWDFMSKVDGF